MYIQYIAETMPQTEFNSVTQINSIGIPRINSGSLLGNNHLGKGEGVLSSSEAGCDSQAYGEDHQHHSGMLNSTFPHAGGLMQHKFGASLMVKQFWPSLTDSQASSSCCPV